MAVSMCSPVMVGQVMAQTTAQTSDGGATPPDNKAEPAKVQIVGPDVIVKGIRGSNKDAADKKKNSKQITDTISAEDAGKLPDSDVPEVLAHITGVQITRQHGEGADVAIRGLQAVGTTINGNAASGGELRSMNHNDEDGGTPDTELGAPQGSLGPTLADIPTALIKSVTVYKTRTADQIEGGIAGTVNVDLRRPLDFSKGFTVAGAFHDTLSSIGNTSSPYGSLLVSNRFDTPIGEMGWLINLAYDQNNYQEDHVLTESPNYFYGGTVSGKPGYLYNPNITPTGTLQPEYITPYRIWDGVQQGKNTRPTLNLAYQWRITPDLDILVEGTYLGSHETSNYNYLELRTQGDGSPIFSNIVTQPGTSIVKSLTESNVGAFVPLYADSQLNTIDNKTYNTNFEIHWHHEKWQINASVQDDWTQHAGYYVYEQNIVNNLHSVNVNLDSPSIDGGGATVTGAQSALSNPANYAVFDFHDGLDASASHEVDGQIDVTYNQGGAFFRSWQFGSRVTGRGTSRYDGYRDAFPGDFAGEALSDFPGSNNLALTKLNFGGLNESFYHESDTAISSNLGAIRQFILDKACGTGANVAPNCIQTTRFDWSTAKPGDADKINSYGDSEQTAAYYAQLNYGFNLYFPIDGIIGGRAASTWGHSHSTQVLYSLASDPVCGYCATYRNVRGGGQYIDFLPNVSGTIHFTSKLQLRLAYTYNVERPTFYDLSPWIVADPNAIQAYEGNPQLKPDKITNYDASLEYYFGRGGVISFAPYLKKPNATFFYSELPGYVAQLGKVVPIYTTRNAGPGTFQGEEFNVSSFFDFLPGFWHNFGGSANFTYYQIDKIDYPVGQLGASFSGNGDAANTSKETYNLQLYYDTPQLGARISYNYRSSYRGDPYLPVPSLTVVNRPTSRLDASLDYTPIKQLTFSIEGTNLLKNNETSYWGTPELPAETRLQAETVQLGFRFRY